MEVKGSKTNLHFRTLVGVQEKKQLLLDEFSFFGVHGGGARTSGMEARTVHVSGRCLYNRKFFIWCFIFYKLKVIGGSRNFFKQKIALAHTRKLSRVYTIRNFTQNKNVSINFIGQLTIPSNQGQ